MQIFLLIVCQLTDVVMTETAATCRSYLSCTHGDSDDEKYIHIYLSFCHNPEYNIQAL